MFDYDNNQKKHNTLKAKLSVDYNKNTMYISNATNANQLIFNKKKSNQNQIAFNFKEFEHHCIKNFLYLSYTTYKNS